MTGCSLLHKEVRKKRYGNLLLSMLGLIISLSAVILDAVSLLERRDRKKEGFDQTM